LGAARSSQAQLFWDANGVAPVDGGTGVWDNGITANWSVDAGGSAYTTWNNASPSDAVFSGTAGNVSINSASNVTANSLLFGVNGYILDGSGSLTLSGAGTIGVTTAGQGAVFNIPIAGSVGLTKVGAGSIALFGTNTYTGATTVNGGTLILGATGVLPAGNPLTISNAVFNSGTNGTSVLSLSLNNGTIASAAGGAMSVGSSPVNSAGTSQIGPALSFSAPATFDVSSGTLIANNVITTTSLTKQGGGVLSLSNASSNSYASVSVTSGTLEIVRDTNLGSTTGSVVIDGATLRMISNILTQTAAGRSWTVGSNGATLDVSFSSNFPTINNTITGPGVLTKIGPTTVLANAANSFGGLIVNRGRWNCQVSGAAGNGDITLAGLSGGSATLGIGGAAALPTVVLSNALHLSTANGGTNTFEINTGDTLQLDGIVDGTGGWTRGTVASANGTLSFTNSGNNYTGDGTLLSGIVYLANNEVVPNSSNIFINGGTLLLNASTETIGGLLSSASTGTVNLGGGHLKIGASNTGTLVFGGRIIGAGNLTKVGTGVQTISNPSNSFTGNVAVSAGTLQVNIDANLGNSANPLIFDGGMLRVNNIAFGTTARNITANAGGGGVDTNGFDITHTGTITGVGTFKKSGAVKLTVNNVRAGGIDVSGGTLTVVAGRNTANTSQVNSVAVTGGAGLDLNDQDLIADTSGTSLTNLQSLLASGYNGNLWNGTGINSTAAAINNATPGTHQTALGYGANSVLGYSGTYSGVTVSPTSLIVRYTYSGDANLDGTVDTIDFNLMAASFGQPGKVWTDGEFDFNGVVDSIDFNLLASNFGQVLTADGGRSMGVLVPEPGSIAIMGSAFGGLLATRRRRR
jgi:autotransporter-associated beta strand protein